MNNLSFDKAQLLEIIKKNREQHRAIFEEAYDGFYKALVAQLDKMKEAALAKKKVSLYVGLTEPVDMTSEYDEVIQMLELTTDNEVVLDQRQFKNYILDEWNWKGQFITSNSLYANNIPSADLEKYNNY